MLCTYKMWQKEDKWYWSIVPFLIVFLLVTRQRIVNNGLNITVVVVVVVLAEDYITPEYLSSNEQMVSLECTL